MVLVPLKYHFPERSLILPRVRYILEWEHGIMKELVDFIFFHVNDDYQTCSECRNYSLIGMNFCKWHKCRERLCPKKEKHHPCMVYVFRCEDHWESYLRQKHPFRCYFEYCASMTRPGYKYCRVHRYRSGCRVHRYRSGRRVY